MKSKNHEEYELTPHGFFLSMAGLEIPATSVLDTILLQLTKLGYNALIWDSTAHQFVWAKTVYEVSARKGKKNDRSSAKKIDGKKHTKRRLKKS